MNGYEDPYLNEYVPVSNHLAAVLEVGTRAGQSRRFHAADALAEQLGLDTERLRHASYALLSSLLAELDRALAEDAGSWVSDIEADRAGRIARAATSWMDVGTALDVLRELGWRHIRPPLTVDDIEEVAPAVVAVLTRRLTDRLRRLLDQWRTRGAWHPDMRLGIVPRAPDRPPSRPG